ncbi:hypothetical protein FHS00_001145 [Limimaricola variabilis]|uniref:Restriction endonuclease n=1 Tax=Limimaricola variabilis TaxID=1492771 RepID=A0ABR6HM13_9RHOB|nr:hypothetical protein [Limimaricola variabilis]MBB3711574.1 hypothetical protein [Limimaricola variabilis]
MPTDSRTAEQFARDKAKGDEVELDFMHAVARLGGSALKIGHAPVVRHYQPRGTMLTPDGTDVAYYIAPDIAFTVPGQPTMLAQVKAKKLEGSLARNDTFFYLDERQLHLLNRAAAFFPAVLLVVYCETLAHLPGYSPFSYVNAEDLREKRTELRKRKVSGKPTFLLPLELFRPIAHLLEEPVLPPASLVFSGTSPRPVLH